MTDTATDKAADAKAPSEWRYKHLAFAFVVAFLVQSLVHPSLCYEGVVKTEMALVIDALVLGRVAVARFTRAKGNGWIFYAALLLASPALIEWIASLA